MEDARFARLARAGTYRGVGRARDAGRTRVDSRFAHMFTDRRFSVKSSVDKRGRPLPLAPAGDHLRRYYSLEGESEDEDENDEDEDERAGRFVRRPPGEGEEVEAEEEEKEEKTGENDLLVTERGGLDRRIRERLHDLEVDYARGEGLLKSESSGDETESSGEEAESSGEEHAWGELDADADTTDTPTSRLAVCNMDWDNVTAQDMMVLFHSFLPPGGHIRAITIYPSEFGLKRLEEEEVRGPAELTEKKEAAEPTDIDHNDDNDDNEEGGGYRMERLRRYQLSRLKYYYAVVECDSAATADHIYTQCDSTEYESSATKLDLRFVPDGETFQQEPKEVCSKLPELSRYKPRLFRTTALQQAKVELTWDATDPARTDLLRSALGGEVDHQDVKRYLASSTDDDTDEERCKEEALDDEEADPISKYKSLLAEIESGEGQERGRERGMEMEVTWGLGVKDKAEKLVKQAQHDDKDRTPFEKLMEKRKEKKKKKKLERQKKIQTLKVGVSEGDHNSSEDDVPSDVDMSDPYFAEELRNNTGGNSNKKKKRRRGEQEDVEDEEASKRRAELELLLEDEGPGGKRGHFSLKKILAEEEGTGKKKRKNRLKQKMAEKKTEAECGDGFELDVQDERFSAVFESHLYNIDPAHPSYKKTKNMQRLIEEKLRRRPTEGPGQEQGQGQGVTPEQARLKVLVKSIKRKTKSANVNA